MFVLQALEDFCGSWLSEYWLARENVEVYGTIRDTMRSDLRNLRNCVDNPHFHLKELNLCDYKMCQNLISSVQPDIIFNLAAETFVPRSFEAPQDTLQVNVAGVMNVLEAVRHSKLDTVVQSAGSSEIFGFTYPSENPLDETKPCRPASPYGWSKFAAEGLLAQYHLSYGMKTILTRTFNHDGPRRGKKTAMSDFTRQIVAIERGEKEPIIYHGLMESIRDYTHVQDICRAYDLATSGKCHYGTPYVIASGVGHSAQQLLEELVARANPNIMVESGGWKPLHIQLKHDPTRDRISDIPLMIGNSTKFRNATGWKPELPFSRIVDDLLEYWRSEPL